MQSIIPALAVASIEASIQFYVDTLGFAEEFTLPGDDGTLIHASIKRGDTSLMFGQLDPSNPHNQGPLGTGVALFATVGDDEDIDAFFLHAKNAGATVIQEPTDQFWGHRDWIIADPDGYMLWIGKQTRAVSAEEMQEAAMAGAPAD